MTIKYKIEIEAEENIRRIARKTEGQTSCRVFLPKEWKDKEVMIVRLPEDEEKSKE